MAYTAISIENLSKSYKIGNIQQRNDTLRDAIISIASRPILRKQSAQIIWALNNISFEVKHGEVLGIIGRNGAGKSTLLKILSRITKPTKGRVIINGRVGSLLEVGTGFHPELTGRENIYLNGAIMGMRKKEIVKKFDEIVEFAEINKFLDTPVKRYSSGMYVRLAFSIAAHLEPSILLVDEVLAVGDIAFQKKCLGKMDEVSSTGRTVLFVSHNMSIIANLCKNSILLENGSIKSYSSSDSVIKEYLKVNQNFNRVEGTYQTKSFLIRKISFSGSEIDSEIIPNNPMRIEIDVCAKIPTHDISLHLFILNNDHTNLIGIDSEDFSAIAIEPKHNTYRFKLNINRCPLPPGDYYLDIYLKSYSNRFFEKIDIPVRFEVKDDFIYGNRIYSKKWHGSLLVDANMNVNELKEL